MTSMRLVTQDAGGKTVAVHFDSATDAQFREGGYSGARKAFGAKKFDKENALAPDQRLVLLVDDVAKLTHPEPKKGKKRAAGGTPKAKAGDKPSTTAAKAKAPKASVKGESEAGWTPPADGADAPADDKSPKKTCQPSMLLSMAMKSGAPPAVLERAKKEVHEPPVKKRKPRKQVVVEESDDDSLPVQPRTDEDDEEEMDFDQDDEKPVETEEAAPAPAAPAPASQGAARAWSAFAETETAPDADDAHGDQWNAVDEDDAGCAVVTVVKQRSPKELSKAFDAQGLLLLEASKWALPAGRVAELKTAIARQYAAKLDEARAEGLVIKKRDHVLKDSETETLAGFNQRPGGRIDMILDDNPAVKGRSWPWEPVVKALLKKPMALNFVGCVVARPGDATQNWHIDGVHSVQERHADADRCVVFCPLTDLDEATGCTEFVPASHFESRGKYKFEQVSSMPRARHYINAGTPVVMDYRLWHRGLPNTSKTDRFLMYCVYETMESKIAKEKFGGMTDALQGGVDGDRAW